MCGGAFLLPQGRKRIRHDTSPSGCRPQSPHPGTVRADRSRTVVGRMIVAVVFQGEGFAIRRNDGRGEYGFPLGLPIFHGDVEHNRTQQPPCKAQTDQASGKGEKNSFGSAGAARQHDEYHVPQRQHHEHHRHDDFGAVGFRTGRPEQLPDAHDDQHHADQHDVGPAHADDTRHPAAQRIVENRAAQHGQASKNHPNDHIPSSLSICALCILLAQTVIYARFTGDQQELQAI